MKVLVTGSNGFLGAALVKRLIAHGEARTIRCLHRPGSDLHRLEPLLKAHPEKLERCVGTLIDPQDCGRALEGVEVVYHLAAALSGAPAEMFLNSVVASKNFLEALVKMQTPAKVVLVSSFGVYGMAHVKPGSVVTEKTPLEPYPERRDIYSHTKHRQEQLFWDYQKQQGFPLTVLRPGVIYGPDGPGMTGRVGLNLFGVFLHLGGNNPLPLSYVDNCADALHAAATHPAAEGQAYNVHDDDLPTASQFLKQYLSEVKPLKVISLPYFATKLMSYAVEWYHGYSKGQLPAIFTPYKSDSFWRKYRYDNRKIKSIGWRQEVGTKEGMKKTFAYLRSLEEPSN